MSEATGMLRGVDSFTSGGARYWRVDSLVDRYWPGLSVRGRSDVARRINETRLLTPTNILGLIGLTHAESLLALAALHFDPAVRADAFSEQARRGVLHGLEGALYLAVLRNPGATREELVADVESQAHAKFESVMATVGARMTRRQDGKTGWRVGDPEVRVVDGA